MVIMPKTDRHLRGWKSIAAYLSVTESTVIRWSKTPGFPVVRSPNGGSVYASTQDLDRWLTGLRDHELRDAPKASSEGMQGAPDVQPSSPTKAAGRRALLIGAGAVAATAAAAAGVVMLRSGSGQPGRGAADPRLEAAYIDARSDMAARTPQSLDRAAEKFRDIVARHPDFVPGFTGLADTYILSCEFGTTDRDQAFRDARAAASTALALAPDDAAANRILGFLTYWTTRDLGQARPYFDRAVASDGSDNMVRLWFGNALIDGGRLAAGLDQLQRTMVLAPDSPAVLTDYAIGQWQAGQTQASISRLADVERRFPTHSGAPGAAALFQLQAGDVAAYLEQSRRWADLIRDPRQTARLAHESEVFASGGGGALLTALARSTPIASAYWHGGELPVAMAASLIGDRDRLIQILTAVATRKTTWRNLRFPAETFQKWKDDAPVANLLRRVLEPGRFPDYPRL